jgi:hypothetical protein
MEVTMVCTNSHSSEQSINRYYRSGENIMSAGKKKIGLLKLFGLSIILLLLASKAFATPIAGSINYSDDVKYVFYVCEEDGCDYTEPVSPYTAIYNYNSQQYSGYITCLDINLTTQYNTTYSGKWYSNYNELSQSQDVINAYKEASYLADQLEGLTTATADPAYVGPIQMAIWTIMLDSSTNNAPMPIDPNTNVGDWITKAGDAVAGGYIPDHYVFVPDDSTSQRFMLNSAGAPPEVPEPATVILVGSGLVGIVGFAKRKRAK